MSKKKTKPKKARQRAKRTRYIACLVVILVAALTLGAVFGQWRNLPVIRDLVSPAPRPVQPAPPPTIPPPSNPSKEYIYGGGKLIATEVAKSDQTITFNSISDKTYGDTPFAISATASSGFSVSFMVTAGPATLSGNTLTLTGAGSVSVRADQAGNDGFNPAQSVTQSFTVAKAAQTITFDALPSKTYGNAPFTVSATGGGSSAPVTFSASGYCTAGGTNGSTITITWAGSCTVTAAQAADYNYNAATDVPRGLTISKATATITVNGYTGAYDGNAHGATGSATGVASENLNGLLTLGASYTNVPGGTANWAFAGNANYSSTSGSATITINKATPTVSWNNPADIVYGTALSSTQLNATASFGGNSVAGTFAYSPGVSTVLNPGNNQTLSTTFTPGGTNFNSPTLASAHINVTPYTYRRSITIDHTRVPNSDQSNFPLLISGTYSYLATVANGGNVQNSNGYDIIFTSDSGCATKLNHEVESYNASTGAVNYWVKVPIVSHTADTSIYMCYGNSTITTDQSNRTAVWDANYKGVWHLGNGNNLNVTDSTNNLNGTNQGATAVNGKVGGAASFDGSSQCISIGTIALTSNLTMEFWSYRTGGNVFEVLFDTGWNSTDGFGAFIRPPPPTNGSWHGFVKQAVMAIDSSTAAVDNTWEHVVWTVDSDLKPRLYINGTLVFTSSDAAALVSQTHGGAIGCRLDSSGNRNANFQGYLDEVRLSNVVRSADRIATEHNNQSSPATFYTISSSGSGSFTYRRSITIDHTKVPNTDQSNFPLLISGTYSYLATVANGGNVQNSNGYDIIFTSDSGCATQLNHEVESYNASTGAVNYWVKVPTVSHTTDTSIYMCYGNSSITTNQSNKSAVWDANYKGVWHLGDGTTLSVADSTNQLNGTNHGAGAISGKVAGGAGFDGSSQYVSMPSTSLTSLITIEFWMARTGTVDVRATPISFGRDGVDGFDVEATSTTHKFTKSGIVRVDSGIAVSGVGLWDHIVWTVDSDLKPRLYVNGSLAFTSSDTQAINATTHGAYLGATEGTAGAIFRYALVQLDEVRLSNTVRSADWIATEYNNQSSPATFYVISSSPLASAPREVDMTTAGIYHASNAPVRTSGGSGGAPGMLTRMLFDVASVVHVSGIEGPSLTLLNVIGQYGWLESTPAQTTVPQQGARVKHPEAGS